jgi:hypothetical protein
VLKFETPRTCMALATALFCAVSADAAPAADRCIVGEAVFGCRSEAEVAQITSYRGDADALRQIIVDNLISGDCRMFEPGEPVYMTGVARDGGRSAVRRPGDAQSYWMPASWSRPVTECSAYSTSRSLREKLGLAATSQAVAPEENAEQTLSRPTALRSAAPECAIKPVMTNAEIAICRNMNR